MTSDTKLATQIAHGVVAFLKKIKKEKILGVIAETLQKEVNTQKAYIYSPVELSEREKKNIHGKVNKITGEQIHSCIFHKDESLIDGMKVYYKDKLWDFSVSSKINKLLNEN